MTFLNPLVLFGLAAAAIPLLLHLLNLRKLRTIEFSSLRFLKELQKTSMRRVRFRQLLLLILRTMLIIALVLAFSRPALRGSFAGLGGSAAASTMVIIVDDSPSMGVRDERGTAFTRAQAAAASVLDLVKDGDRVVLLPLSEAKGAPPPAAPRPASAVREALARLAVTSVSTPVIEGLRQAGQIFSASTDANKEVVLVTDGQAAQFTTVPRQFDTLTAFDPRARLFVLTFPPARDDNAAVTATEVLTRIVAERKPVRLRAQVANSGNAALRGLITGVSLDGKRASQRSIDIPSRGAVVEQFSFSPTRRGILGGFVEIEDDILDADNRHFFTLPVQDALTILVVGNSPSAVRLPALALTLAGDTSLAGHITLRQVTESELPTVDVDRFDVVILSGLRGLTGASSERVARFVRGGGGLIVFPGPEMVPSLYNEFLMAALGLPRLADGPITQPQGASISFGRVDLRHPLFDGMFETDGGLRASQPSVDPPQITTALPLVAGERGTAVISLSSGGAFLAEYAVGGGRVLFFAVEAGLGWSDFPVKGVFAPLLHRAVMYLGSQASTPPSILAGDPLSLGARVRDFSDRDRYTLTLPDGATRRLVPGYQPSTGSVIFEAGIAREPGVYTIQRQSENGPARTIAAAAVNLAATESDLRSVNDQELSSAWKRAGIAAVNVQRVPPGQSPAASILESRFGVELWKLFLLLAAVLALTEMAVARVSASRGRKEPQE